MDGSVQVRAIKPAARARLPVALAWAVSGLLLASAVAWLGAVASLARRPHTVLILGDSLFAGYRLAPGSRFQDWLARELGSSWGVINFASPAAQPGDFYLQLTEAEFLRVKPDLVVVGLAPQKLVPEFDQASRLNEDGTNLRWLPLNQEGYRFYQTLDPHLQRVAWLRKAGLAAGFYEALRAVSLEYVEWPLDRRRRRHASNEQRQAWIREHAGMINRRWEEASESEAARLPTTREAQDFAFLVDALQRRGVRVVAVVPPELHTSVLRMLSPTALRRLHDVYEQTLVLCNQLGVPVIDFNTPLERARFMPADWDDVNHLRAPACFRRMARAVEDFMRTRAMIHA